MFDLGAHKDPQSRQSKLQQNAGKQKLICQILRCGQNWLMLPTHEIKTDNRMGYGVEIEVLPS